MIDWQLEAYLRKKGLDPEKIDEDIFNRVANRIEDDIDEYVKEEVFDKFAEEWVFLEIEQQLDEHPEWKLKKKSSQSKKSSANKECLK